MSRSTALRFACIASSLTFLGAALPPSTLAQVPNPTSVPGSGSGMPVLTQENGQYLYRVNVVQRNLDAVNYLHRSGSTRIGFEGTALLPGASGEAKVQSERGHITIDARFKGLVPANSFGKEYLTYVLWAISPDGRPNNLGEILPDGSKNDIKTSTSFQSFGMIVTAEPYYSVTQPSDVVVLQNVILDNKTTGVLEKVNAHFFLLPRGLYAPTAGSNAVENPITRNERSPLELYEAYNAVRIAKQAGAGQYAPDILSRAEQDLRNAADIDSNKHGDRKTEITFARGAVERAEDARVVTLRKQAAERQLNAERAKVQAQVQAANSQMQAQQSQLDAERAQAAKAQADAQRARAEAAAAQAQAQAAQANQAAQSSNAVRERLRGQLNSVLQTSETARGLIVNMSDVLFDTGKYTLKTDAQIALAKVAGILQAYPGLKLQVEGYTDSVGTADYNQKLSENRAGAVRDFLVQQGVQMSNITATGYGESDPVASNDTAKGRSQNRRVQLVVSGDAIGVDQQSGPSGAASPAQPQ